MGARRLSGLEGVPLSRENISPGRYLLTKALYEKQSPVYGKRGTRFSGGLPSEPGTSPAAHHAVSLARSMVRAGKPPFTRGTLSPASRVLPHCGGEAKIATTADKKPPHRNGEVARRAAVTRGPTSNGQHIRPHPSALRAATFPTGEGYMPLLPHSSVIRRRGADAAPAQIRTAYSIIFGQ